MLRITSNIWDIVYNNATSQQTQESLHNYLSSCEAKGGELAEIALAIRKILINDEWIII